METLASGNAAPANAESTAQVETGEADANPAETTGDGSAPSVPEADTSAPKVKEDPVQKRIDQLTREKYDALRDRDRTSYEVERLTAQLADLQKAQKPEAAPQNDFPTLEQHGYDEGKYQAAVAKYFADIAEKRADARVDAKLSEAEARREAEKANQSWASKEAELIKSKPDYVEKVQQAATLPISKEVQEVLKGHELGPQIALHMVENAEAARMIMRLPLPAQLMEVGRISAKLEAAKLPPKPAVSQAPPPPSKVDADDAVATVKVDAAESDTLSDKEWTRRRNAQEQARLRKIRGS